MTTANTTATPNVAPTERDFTIPPSDASPESVAAFERRRTAYRCAELAYAAIGVDVDRPAWDHLGSERRAVMAAVIDEAITANVEAEVARRQTSAPGVEEALADLLGQVGCAAHHRDVMAGALRTAITAHVGAEIARRLAAAPGVEEAIDKRDEWMISNAMMGVDTRLISDKAPLRAAIAADRERAVEAGSLAALDEFRKLLPKYVTPDEARRLVDAHGDSIRRVERAAARRVSDATVEPAMEQIVTAQIDTRAALLRALGVEA